MRPANLLIATLLIGTPVWVAAQAPAPATPPPASGPETFTATAQAKNATSAISGALQVRINRYTPEFDRKSVEDALRFGGYPKFLPALRRAPIVGELVLGQGAPYAIRYARETQEAGGRVVVVITDKPVFFLGAGTEDTKSRAGYEIAIVRLQVDAAGRWTGTMAAAARVRPDGNGGVRLDDYADLPIELTNLTRRPS